MKKQIASKIILKTFILLLLSLTNFISAQPVLPQREITLNTRQSLTFGEFYNKGNGGTIFVNWQGIRSTTGDIIAMPSSQGTPAIYEVKLCQGRNITITYPESSTLKNSDGYPIILDIGPTEKGGNGVIFATEKNCNFITLLRVGGTLHIPANTPLGVFSGNFEIYFEQQ